MTLPANMAAKIERALSPVSGLAGLCWLWTGALNSKGYPCIAVNGRSQLAHRVSYQIHKGAIPAGLQIDHLCVVRRCINPDHLEAVTAGVNVRRTDAVHKSHCVHGHRLHGDNVIVKRSGDYIVRNCRTCTNERKRQRRTA